MWIVLGGNKYRYSCCGRDAFCLFSRRSMSSNDRNDSEWLSYHAMHSGVDATTMLHQMRLYSWIAAATRTVYLALFPPTLSLSLSTWFHIILISRNCDLNGARAWRARSCKLSRTITRVLMPITMAINTTRLTALPLRQSLLQLW